jgi:hypothetical protein
VNPRDFLALARALIVSPGEAERRTAASRAYYASFHVARNLFEAVGFTVPRADRAHAYLWLRLQNCGDSGGAQTGIALDALRQLRNRADYDRNRPIALPVVQAHLQVAEDAIDALDALAVEPTRSQITAEMVRYERDVLHDVTWHP